MELLIWDIYEIRSSASLQGMMLRGRLRKYANLHGINFLTENDEEGEMVRFAVLVEGDYAAGTVGRPSVRMSEFIESIVPGAEIEKVMERIPNPVLSKLKVNLDDRYTVDALE